MSDDNNENKKEGNWLQSTANFFIIIESTLNIARYISQIYYAYQTYKDVENNNVDREYNNNNNNDNNDSGDFSGDFRGDYRGDYRGERPLRSPSFPLNPPEDVETDVESETCKICFTNKIRTVNLPCGHLVFCFGCSRDFVTNNVNHVCPICRERITQIKIVYN